MMWPWVSGAKWLWLATLLVVLVPAVARAQAVQNIILRNSFAPLGAGARGVGMGGAFIAVADDGTAATFNPAGLAQLRRSELAFVFFHSNATSALSLNTPGGIDTRTTSFTNTAPDFFGWAVPFDVRGRRLTVQASYQRAVDLTGEGLAVVPVPSFDAGLEGVENTFNVAEITPQQSGAMHTVSGALAYQLTPRLSLGGSLNYWVGEWTASGRRTIRVQEAPRNSETLARVDTDFEHAQSFRGFNVNAGFLLRSSWLSIGGVLQLPVSGAYDLNDVQSTTTTTAAGTTDPTAQQTSVTSRLHWPGTAGIGVALRPISRLTVAFDFASSRWSRTYTEELPDGVLLTPSASEGEEVGFTDRNFFDLLPKTVTSTRDSDRWHVGAEYLVTLPRVIVPLRAGLFRDHSPVADAVTDEGRRIDGYTIGTGLNFQSFVFDFAYERRESDGFVGIRQFGQRPNALNAEETVAQNRFVGSLIYRFTDDDPFRRMLRKIFVSGE